MSVRDESEPELTSRRADALIAPGAVTALIARLAHAPTRDAPPLLLPGSRIGRYEIIRAIGHGGFGVVYEAHDNALNRLVALKVLGRARAESPDAAHEGEAAARLAHPNIAMLHDVGVIEGGAPYLVYEFLHGETLESRLSRGPMPAREALEVGASVARALVHAHCAGVIHRDLKPANVFLTAEGDVKVLDFGIALLVGRDAPAGGTPAYMAPEQRRGEAEDVRTDLYALGLLLREMFVGEQDGRSVEAHAVARVPGPVSRVLAALLQDDPAARPRSARAALGHIEAAARALSAPRVRRRRLGIAAAALALLATMVSGVFLRERLRPGAPAAVVTPSIAVLPFADLSAGKDQEYFADGLSEEILDALAHVDGLHVAGRTSSFSFKGKNEDLRSVGKKLNVAALLEGSVRKEGNRVRVTAQIVSATDGYHLWSETYDRELTGIFAVQDEIARAVVDALKVKLLPGRGPSTRGHRTRNQEAYTQYLLGRQFWNTLSKDGHRRAVQAYQRALALDPSYSPAWAGLAIAAFDQGDDAQNAVAFEEGCRRGLAAADRSVAVDPGLTEAFSTRGFLRMICRWDFGGAMADLERALELNPGDAYAQRRYGVLQLQTGRAREALAALRRSIEVDPLDALTWRWIGLAELAAEEPARAREGLSRTLEIRPGDPYASYLLAITFLVDHQPAAAMQAIERSPEEDSDHLVVVALAEHELGHARESRRAVNTLRSRAAHDDSYASYDLARVHAWLGERDLAFRWLDRATARIGMGDVLFVKFDPLMRKLRDDPRYIALLRRMNLPLD